MSDIDMITFTFMEDVDVPEDEPCKGKIYRCRKSTYVSPTNGNVVAKVEMIPLKRKSCGGCEQCAWLEEVRDEDMYLNGGEYDYLPPYPKHGKLYEYMVTGQSRNWETGLVDDYVLEFVEVEE